MIDEESPERVRRGDSGMCKPRGPQGRGGLNKEAGIVGQSSAMPMTLSLAPTDEGIAGLAVPGSRAAALGCHGPPGPGPDQVAEVFADAVAKTQVVMAMEPSPKESVLA